jgi:hypothetical protein
MLIYIVCLIARIAVNLGIQTTFYHMVNRMIIILKMIIITIIKIIVMITMITIKTKMIKTIITTTGEDEIKQNQ